VEVAEANRLALRPIPAKSPLAGEMGTAMRLPTKAQVS
jgi:hypothetical protein